MGNMETKQTNWEDLSISNDFLFGKVMQNPELCRKQRKTGNGGMSI